MEQHFNVTVYIVSGGRVLLIDHKKLEKWLPAGGHVDLNESPEDAAKREAKEETGLDIELVKMNDLTTAWGIQTNVIKEDHVHHDVIYLAKPVGGELKENIVETNGIKWYTLAEILDPEFKTFDKTRAWCKLFLK